VPLQEVLWEVEIFDGQASACSGGGGGGSDFCPDSGVGGDGGACQGQIACRRVGQGGQIEIIDDFVRVAIVGSDIEIPCVGLGFKPDLCFDDDDRSAKDGYRVGGGRAGCGRQRCRDGFGESSQGIDADDDSACGGGIYDLSNVGCAAAGECEGVIVGGENGSANVHAGGAGEAELEIALRKQDDLAVAALACGIVALLVCDALELRGGGKRLSVAGGTVQTDESAAVNYRAVLDG